ncbi:Isochorismatase-like protein [Achaetomium macrosporum]|uniref:Isochorismatase-like protein n=1 Tax=Achaetomium macrosporum TaxID=79813 RepID=A0AAN7C1N5_9PEZI|nr:Isochorismatase-like protein [Achaetomium macrosporum]
MPTKTALFVIDIQNDLTTDPKTRIPHADRIRAAGTKMLSVARELLESNNHTHPDRSEVPPPALIVFVQHEENPKDGPLVRGSEPWKLVFEPRADAPYERLVAKRTRDTFKSNPSLASELKEQHGIQEIVAFGIQSECCVEATCEGALAAGFRVTLLSGAHSTYDDIQGRDGGMGKAAVEIEREVEERLKGKGARVVAWEGVVGEWEKDACSHD